MLRWGLVYEERDAEAAVAVPGDPAALARAGRAGGGRRVPTRFGEVGFSLRSTFTAEAIVKLRLPKKGVGAEVGLRLRLPDGQQIATARLGEVALTVAGDVCDLPQGLSGEVKLAVQVG